MNMPFPTKMTQIVTTKNSSIYVERNELHEMLSSISDDTPLIVISIIGCQDIGKSLLLNYMLEFLKAGCNHSWCISGVEKFPGFNLIRHETKDNWGIKAYLVPITFSNKTFCVLVLDAKINDKINSSTLNSKLQLLCIAMSNILLYMKPDNAENIVQEESDLKLSVLQYAQLFKDDTTARNSLCTLMVDTADNILNGKEKNVLSTKDHVKAILDETPFSLKGIFGKSMTVLLPKHSEWLPDDFQGQLKFLHKCYKDHLKSFLMGSFSLTDLMEIAKNKKCYSNRHDFNQRLFDVINIINGSRNTQSSGKLKFESKMKTAKSNPMTLNTCGLMSSEKYPSQESLIKLDKSKNIIICGLKIEDNVNHKTAVMNFLSDIMNVKCNVEEVKIRNNPAGLPSFVVTLESKADKFNIFKNGNKLKPVDGSKQSVFINDDLTQTEYEKQKILREHMRKAKTEGEKAWIYRQTLYIGNEKFCLGGDNELVKL